MVPMIYEYEKKPSITKENIADPDCDYTTILQNHNL